MNVIVSFPLCTTMNYDICFPFVNHLLSWVVSWFWRSVVRGRKDERCQAHSAHGKRRDVNAQHNRAAQRVKFLAQVSFGGYGFSMYSKFLLHSQLFS